MLVAAGYWEQAGDQAFNRPALSEAANQFERAVQCLRSLPESAESRLRELDLRVKLSHVAMLRHGQAHSITAAANTAARAARFSRRNPAPIPGLVRQLRVQAHSGRPPQRVGRSQRHVR